MKHSYLSMAKTTPDVNNSFYLGVSSIKNISILLLRSTKLYPDGSSDYITEDDFDGDFDINHVLF